MLIFHDQIAKVINYLGIFKSARSWISERRFLPIIFSSPEKTSSHDIPITHKCCKKNLIPLIKGAINPPRSNNTSAIFKTFHLVHESLFNFANNGHNSSPKLPSLLLQVNPKN